MNIWKSRWVFFALTFAIVLHTCQGEACGGLLVSLGGEINLPQSSNSSNGPIQCVWLIQLVLKQTIGFTLNRLDDPSATLSLYPEHEANETVLSPIRLTRADTGKNFHFVGQTLVVILTRTDPSKGLSFTWDSLSTDSTFVFREAIFTGSNSGRILLNQLAPREKLVWAFNLDPAVQQSLALNGTTNFENCELQNPCDCAYFGLYEIAINGGLNEVERICGRSLTFQKGPISTKLIAFIHINSTSPEFGKNTVELSWSSPNNSDDPKSVVSLNCGGLVNLPPAGQEITVEYKSLEEYGNDERCLWTLNDNYFEGSKRPFVAHLTLISEGFEQCCDGLSLLTWEHDRQLNASLLIKGVQVEVGRGLRTFLSFTSDSSGNGFGFRIKIAVISYENVSINNGETTNGNNWYFSTISGKHGYSYWPATKPSLFSAVVNPRDSNAQEYSFEVEIVDLGGTECVDYRFLVYEILERGQFKIRAYLCENFEGSAGAFTSSYPLITLVYSESNPEIGGFGISWTTTTKMQ